MSGKQPGAPEPKPEKSDEPATYVPKPPSPAELDRISEAQALIADEWADGGDEARSDEAPSDEARSGGAGSGGAGSGGA